ncbi:MAG: hypothetical protein JWO06_624 [Bacteroidota bacterium]|nr:hypothetical protein [Bacteroidota bacterium]
MKLSVRFAIAFVSLTILVQSCKKETGPQGPAGPALTGTLFGFVELYDQYGAKVIAGQNATTVTVTNASGASTSTTTDSMGKYTFSNLSTGQYTFSASNPGYGSITGAAQGFLGGGNIDRDAKLSAIPTFTDSTLTITDSTSTGYIVLSGTLSGVETRRRTVAVFAGSGSVSSTPGTYKLTYNLLTNNANNTVNNFVLKIPVQDLYDQGYTTGATINFAVYGAAANFASSSSSEDFANGQFYYNALSPTAFTGSVILQ